MNRDVIYRHWAKILGLVLIAAVAGLMAYSMDAVSWLERTLKLRTVSETHFATSQAEKFTYGVDRPIEFGSVSDPLNAYFRLKLRFRSEDSQGHAEIFRSSTLETGVRVEIDNAAVAVYIREKPSVSLGLRKMLLTDALVLGKWHVLELEGMNGAFVRANFDGRPVMLYGGAEVAIDTSAFVLGSAVDAARPFKGEMADLYLIKGNLEQPPRRAIALVFATVAALVAAFLLVLWICLRQRPPLRALLAKVVVLALPLVGLLGYFEYRLSFLDTSYFYKRIALEDRIKTTEVLVTGSSNTFFGVNPDSFSRPGFNLAFPGHGMFYDARLVEKFSQRMPALRMVVLTVNFFTLGTADAEFSQNWRTFFERQYFGIPTRGSEGALGALKFWFEPSNFSKIAIFGDSIRTQAIQDYRVPVDVIAAPSGWFDAGTVPADPSLRIGSGAANAHSVSTSERNYEENLRDWEGIINDLKRRNIAVAIVELPTDASYHTALDPVKTGQMKKVMDAFAVRHGVRFIDYTNDPRFSSLDFSWELVDHMNARGAEMFSKILDVEVIQPELK